MSVQKETGVFLFTTNVVEGFEVEEYFGLVSGVSIQGVHFFKDLTAYLSDKFGGRVGGYESSMRLALEQAQREMAKNAIKLGANAVLAIDMDTGDVTGRMLMASCYGTAVKIKRR